MTPPLLRSQGPSSPESPTLVGAAPSSIHCQQILDTPGHHLRPPGVAGSAAAHAFYRAATQPDYRHGSSTSDRLLVAPARSCSLAHRRTVDPGHRTAPRRMGHSGDARRCRLQAPRHPPRHRVPIVRGPHRRDADPLVRTVVPRRPHPSPPMTSTANPGRVRHADRARVRPSPRPVALRLVGSPARLSTTPLTRACSTASNCRCRRRHRGHRRSRPATAAPGPLLRRRAGRLGNRHAGELCWRATIAINRAIAPHGPRTRRRTRPGYGPRPARSPNSNAARRRALPRRHPPRRPATPTTPTMSCPPPTPQPPHHCPDRRHRACRHRHCFTTDPHPTKPGRLAHRLGPRRPTSTPITSRHRR